jgi:uncharacterized repeat protein (TIGR03837 family)
MTHGAQRWDVFCSVVDNFGDAGVCWRLARILAAEHGLDVTLWIDALAPLSRLAPAVDPARDAQCVDGVTVRRIADPLPSFTPADVVVEAFVGGLPDAYVEAMAARSPPPHWLRLEYLALEPGFDSHHGLPSPHPRLPLARTFWFPGIGERTGGLLRERGLFAARDAFRADAAAQATLWASLGVRAPRAGELRVSMFCYADAPLAPLLDAWAGGETGVTCVVPEGVASGTLDRWTRGALPHARGGPCVAGRLALAVVPFVAQDDYDRLLWACDLNFVRGEDSFIRAQWAARPFVWQAYAQSEDAHAAKVAAFLDVYTCGLDPSAAAAAGALFGAWNGVAGNADAAAAWPAFEAALPSLARDGDRWADRLARLPELAAGMVKSAKKGL